LPKGENEMSVSEQVLRDVTIVLDGSNEYECVAAKGCPNRYMDGVDWFYFETLSHDLVDDGTYYHTWHFEDGEEMTGWLVLNDRVEIL
jgi:hypothetical protein